MAEGNGALGEVRLAEVEDALGRIPSVTAARVVTGPGGKVTEVHVLAGRDRSPKQLVRDIQSVAMASFGLEIDYRTVSVVQLEDPPVLARAQPQASPAPATDPPAPPSATEHGQRPQAVPDASAAPQARPGSPRARLVAVGTLVSGPATEARVTIILDGAERTGSARGPATAGNVLIGRAVADALSPMLNGTVIDIGHAEVVSSGGHDLAVCVVHTATTAGDVTVAGAAVVRRDHPEAIARATMDALNRIVTRAPAAAGTAHGSEHDASDPPRPTATA